MSMIKTIQQEAAAYNATLVAVSKTKPVEQIMELYDQGQKDFGENRVQELVDKQALMPKDIRWHMIGHLQKNKVKYIAPFVHLIHAVDSIALLKTIDKEAKKNDRIIDILIQIKIASEESKFGIDETTTNQLVEQSKVLENVNICGVMGMATFTNDLDQIRSEFGKLKICFKTLKSSYFNDHLKFKEISMGMSGDYKLALEEGSTMLRIGSLLFGAR